MIAPVRRPRLLLLCILAAGGARQASAAPSAIGAMTAGTSCTTASDCPLPGAPCELCPDGTTACPIVDCVAGQCGYQFPACPATCAAGLSWCPLNGRCVNPACLSCCQFGNSCASAADCGSACVTCPDGSSSCAVGQCGTELAAQCFYPEPICPAPRPVPTVPAWLILAAAGALLLLGLRAPVARRSASPRRC